VIVIDASVAVSWCFAGEATAVDDEIPDWARTKVTRVPTLWHLKTGNVLWQAERRNRIT
jgi:predicted nucleic acid-binding protein